MSRPDDQDRTGMTRGATVVVAAHNAGATLEASVRSALGQDAVVQCVVVDDASTDGTLGLARRLAQVDRRVEVVGRPERGGPSRARNDGLVRARGARVCFLDADDVLVDGALGDLAAALDAAPGAIVAMGRFRALGEDQEPAEVGRWGDEQLRPVVRRHGRLIESPGGVTPEALVTRLVSPPPGAWLVDAAAARAVGGFDALARRSEDLELLVRLAACGQVVCLDRDVLEYARHGTQRSAARSRRRWGRAYTLWRMLRAAPSARDATRLARGMAAYHLELWASRRGSAHWTVRAMGARNLAAASLLRLAGVMAAALPRHVPPPLRATPVAVD